MAFQKPGLLHALKDIGCFPFVSSRNSKRRTRGRSREFGSGSLAGIANKALSLLTIGPILTHKDVGRGFRSGIVGRGVAQGCYHRMVADVARRPLMPSSPILGLLVSAFLILAPSNGGLDWAVDFKILPMLNPPLSGGNVARGNTIVVSSLSRSSKVKDSEPSRLLGLEEEL